MAIFSILYEVCDRVKLPFDETGTIVSFNDVPWGARWNVRIRKSNGFNKTNQIIDFFERDLELEEI